MLTFFLKCSRIRKGEDKKWVRRTFFSLAFFICSYNNLTNIDGNKQS